MKRSATALFQLLERQELSSSRSGEENVVPAGQPGQNGAETWFLATLNGVQAGTWVVIAWVYLVPSHLWSWILLGIVFLPLTLLALQLWAFLIAIIATFLPGRDGSTANAAHNFCMAVAAIQLFNRPGAERWGGAAWLLWAAANLTAWTFLKLRKQ